MAVKKIFCIILVLCAVIALCAIGVYADDPFLPLDSSDDYYLVVGSTISRSHTLPCRYNDYNNNRTSFWIRGPGPSDKSLWVADNSLVVNYRFTTAYNMPVTSTNISLHTGSGFSGSISDVSVSSDGYTTDISLTYTFSSDYVYSSGSFFPCAINVSVRGIYGGSNLLQFGAYSLGSVYEPDPEFSQSVNLSYYFTPKVFTSGNPHNINNYEWGSTQPVPNNGSMNFLNYYFNNSGFYGYVAVHNANFSTVLTNNTVLNGSFEFEFDSYSGEWKNYTKSVHFIFADSYTPFSGNYYEVPEEWFTLSSLSVENSSQIYSYYTYTFYLTLPDDFITTIGFNPSYICFYLDPLRYSDPENPYFNAFADSYSTNYFSIDTYSVQLYYYTRSSSSKPVPEEPIVTPPPVKTEEENLVDYGFDTELEIINNYYDDSSSSEAQSIFNISGLSSCFSSVYTALSYSGSDFSFTFPASGTVPFLNVQLWSAQDIPIKFYIDSLPNGILVCFRFGLWLGCGVILYKLVKSLVSVIFGEGGFLD